MKSCSKNMQPFTSAPLHLCTSLLSLPYPSCTFSYQTTDVPPQFAKLTKAAKRR